MSTLDPTPQLSVVIPTYNERDNIQRLIRDVAAAMGPTSVEIIVVDDASPDGTGDLVRESCASDSRVRLVQRDGKAGLASAVFEGATQATAEFVCVMDADLSHDPEEVPDMLVKAQQGYDVVVGSRYARGAAFVGQSWKRRGISYAMNTGARVLLRLRTRDVLTGYAVVRRSVLASTPTRYSSPGFKWLLEVLATNPGLRVYEWPIVFRERSEGESKASIREAITFAVLCAKLFTWKARHAVRLA
ncbi:MAG: polyprenol monophosphomannose synthase [Chloroflexi bacterium]|nr:polyprenol monophosphomannose synthase [Chloroflexota bacterium]